MTKRPWSGGISKALALNCGAFALGALGGFGLAACLRASGALGGGQWLAGYALGFSAGVEVSFWEVLWNTLRWLVFVWGLGFTAFGAWMIPVMFALRGFFLCFSVAGLCVSGEGGFLLALLLFGLTAVVTLPVFFFLGVRSWTQAAGQRGRLWVKPGEVSLDDWLKNALALGCAVCCAGAEYWLLPILLKMAAPLLGA